MVVSLESKPCLSACACIPGKQAMLIVLVSSEPSGTKITMSEYGQDL